MRDGSPAIRLLPCGSISADLTLVANQDYLLGCQLVVGEGRTIVIAEGVTIVALASDDESAPAVIVAQGGTIHASGTASHPITFTSLDQDTVRSGVVSTDSRISRRPVGRRGKWGGLVILGRAPINAPGGTAMIEGLREYAYGGGDPMDSSGVLRYVRVWFGGAVIGADNEINGITFGGVGAGTEVDHCEVAFSLDDGIEFFGGTVNAKRLSVLFSGDDGIDIDQGYQGSIQFALVLTGSHGHHALEIDSGTAGQPDAEPRSTPSLTSLTLVGSSSQHADGGALVLLRNGPGGHLANVVLASPNPAHPAVQLESCGSVPIRGAASNGSDAPQPGDGLTLEMSSILLVSEPPSSAPLNRTNTNGTLAAPWLPAAPPIAVDASCLARGAGSLGELARSTMDSVFVGMPSGALDFDDLSSAFDPIPALPTGALCAGAVSRQTAAPGGATGFFEAVECIGAFPSAGEDANWLKGWSLLDQRWVVAARPSAPPERVAWPGSMSVRDVSLLGWLCVTVLLPVLICLYLCKQWYTVRPRQASASAARPTADAWWERSRGAAPGSGGSRRGACLQQLFQPAKALWRRVVSKPFYRWAFHEGRRFTDEAIELFTLKYLRKYVLKRQKLKLEGERKMSKEQIECLVLTAAAALAQGGAVDEALRAAHGDVAETVRAGLAVYAQGLNAACRTNIGLSHAKAREYWIYRGPRQLITTVCFIVGIVLMNEVIRDQSFEDRVVNISTSMLATLVACIMLYYRLPDSIRSGVCRSAHDYYAVGKEQLAREAAVMGSSSHPKRRAAEPSASENSQTPSEFETDNEESKHSAPNPMRSATRPDSAQSCLDARPSLDAIPSCRSSTGDGSRSPSPHQRGDRV